MNSLPEKYVITIGRSFGAGGRFLGKMIADKLGIAYYDKELLCEAAKHAGMDADIFEKNDERAPGFLAGIMPMSMGYNPLAWYTGPNSSSGEAVYGAQSEFIRAIADRGPCVIVGRTADYILRDNPNVVSVFLHAPEEECIKRIMSRHDCETHDKARSILRKTNRLRADFYNFYTDRTWGDAKSYHLTLDSSSLPPESIADIIIEYTKAYLSNLAK
jgi:hypothetical protein